MSANATWCRVTVVGPCGSAVASWCLRGDGAPDLGVVDGLARLQLAAVRRGNVIVLSDVTAELDALLELAGLGRRLGR